MRMNQILEGYCRRPDAYQRDYDHSVAGMDRSSNHRDDERHDLDPSEWYIVKDSKMFKVTVYPNQEQEAIARGYSRSREEAKAKAEQQGVTENFGNYYNENIASKVFSQHPDLTSEDDVLNAAWEHVVRDMGRKKAGHLFNYDEDFPSDLVSSYFYLQKQKQGVAESLATKIAELSEMIASLKESATAGATSSGNIATVVNPHLSPGKARGMKSFTGSPGKSGTKSPPQPKPKNNTGVNGLDVKSVSIFGGPKAR